MSAGREVRSRAIGIRTVNKSEITEKIGQVSRQRFLEILDGIRMLTEPREIS